MKKTFQKALALVLCVLLFSTPVSALETQKKTLPPSIGALSESPNSSFKSTVLSEAATDGYSVMAAAAAPVSILYVTQNANVSGSTLQVSAETAASCTCSRIMLSIDIEKWNGSSWVYYKAYSGSRYQAAYHYLSNNFTVDRGYYYRALVTSDCTASSSFQVYTQYGDAVYVP